jgi:hypothetical protein
MLMFIINNHRPTASCHMFPVPTRPPLQDLYVESQGFWSLTIYDKQLNLVPNPINRYAVSHHSRTPLELTYTRQAALSQAGVLWHMLGCGCTQLMLAYPALTDQRPQRLAGPRHPPDLQ